MTARSRPRRRALAALVAAPALLALPVAARAEVGDRVVWSDIRLVDGGVLTAAELRRRPVVVEFWATWCPFCKKQNPVLQRLHAEQGGRGLTVLTFSIDRQPSDVVGYMKQHGYTFAAAMAGPQSQQWFPKRKGLPVVYVVDTDGRVVFHEAGEMFPEDILGLARYARP